MNGAFITSPKVMGITSILLEDRIITEINTNLVRPWHIRP